MKKITHPIYKDYPEQPYISPDRDIKAWETNPENFPYKAVEKSQMKRLPEGLLPGDIIMLWRIGFNTYTNESIAPQYFEYKYGVDSDESIKTLIHLGYAKLGNVPESLDIWGMVVLKRILKKYNLKATGKKDEILSRVLDNIPEEKLDKEYPLRRYIITASGKELLKKYDDIIQKHGPKKM